MKRISVLLVALVGLSLAAEVKIKKETLKDVIMKNDNSQQAMLYRFVRNAMEEQITGSIPEADVYKIVSMATKDIKDSIKMEDFAVKRGYIKERKTHK